ncbi:hypothetical protein X798_06846 [Onchocerca flexuosa]|uniref:Eukaryotic translation initiation factor 3 subunit L n=1 Tax=Onchocerca flexuosa TaxID=387005 RepID=A0A238BNE4_9BILA|nr:hypothetical protein X798_06846 [Onchocerca flexuosa]
MVRDSLDDGHTGDPERDLAYEREHIRRDTLNDEVVPDDVAQYLIYFKRMIDEENVVEIHNLYEHGFPDLTERYFQQRLWPNEEAVENIVGSDSRIFIILYKELYFRHVYTRMQRGPSLAHRFDSYQNYQELFCEVLTPEKQPLSLQLPNVWLWDIIDEFVYQFQAFCLYKANPGKRSPEEYEDLLSIEQNQSGLYNTVPSCLVTFHYFVGFSHMMMRNYGEATKIFVNCLLYIQRTKTLQQQNQQQKKNFQYDVIGKTNEQLYHLLAICLTLQPQRIDDSIQSQLYERTGERMNHMSNGNIDEFRLAFQQGCPKFLSPTTVVYEGPNQAKEPLLRQCNAFLEEIESQIMLPILRGYLKLYTTLPTRKLASFMDVSEADYDSFVGKLLSFKMIVNELGKECMDRCEIDDSTTDLDFYVDKDMIIIADTKVARRIGEYFVKQIQKLQEVNRKLKELPVIPTASS